MFTDDIAFVAQKSKLSDIQEIITRFSKSAKVFGLKINLNKTEVMYQSSPPGITWH